MKKNKKRNNRHVMRDVYVILTENDHAIIVAPDKNARLTCFGDFVTGFAEHTLGSNRRPIPETALLHYRIRGAEDAPMTDPDGEWTPFADHVYSVINDRNIPPEMSIPLYDAMYCRQMGIDPLAPENGHDKLVGDPVYMACIVDYTSVHRESN